MALDAGGAVVAARTVEDLGAGVGRGGGTGIDVACVATAADDAGTGRVGVEDSEGEEAASSPNKIG